ncbi:MAG: protein kinase, partial [Pirellulaceae bacterium]
PGNLLLDENGNSWVTDFGLAQTEDQATLTGTGDLLGTLRYMSPEQVLGQSGQVDGRSDVYGLGITLYELLTLQPAFAGDNRERILRHILEEDPPPPRQVNAAIPRDLETIVLKAIDKDLAHRFRTADELAEDLHRFLNDEPIRARRPGLWEQGIKWCKRHQQVAISTAALLLLLISVLGIATVWINYERERAVVNLELAQRAAARQNHLRQTAEQSELRAQQLLYFADMKLASQALRERNLLQYAKLLDRHRPSSGRRDLRDFAWHYLWDRGHVAHQELARHDDQVRCVRVSHDGRWIASAGADGLIHLGDSDGQQHIIDVSGETEEGINSIAFSPDSRGLVSVGSDGLVRLWDLESRHQRWAVAAHQPDAAHNRVAFAADGELIASCGSEPEIQLWDAGSGEPRGVLRGHGDTIFGLAASPEEPLLASASRDQTVRLWDLPSRSEAELLKAHRNRLTSVAFSSDGEMLASGATDRMAHLWEVSSGKKLAEIKHLDEVGAVDFSADGRWLAVGDRNHSLHLWRIESDGEFQAPEQVPPQWQAHDGRVNSVHFLPDGRLLSGGQDGRVKLWEPFSDRARQTVELPDDARVNDAAFTRNGQLLVLAGRGGVYVWNVAAETMIARMDTDPRGLSSLAVAPDGTTVAVTDDGGKVVISDLTSQSRVASRQLGGQASNLSRPSFSPDSLLLAVPSWTDDVLWIVDASTGRTLAELPARQCHDAVFSADGSEVAVDTQNDIVIWDWAAGRRVRTLRGHDSTVNDLALSPDRRLLASASNDRQVKVWNWASGEQRSTFSGHQDRVMAVSFSADGRLLFSGSRDGSLYVW